LASAEAAAETPVFLVAIGAMLGVSWPIMP